MGVVHTELNVLQLTWLLKNSSDIAQTKDLTGARWRLSNCLSNSGSGTADIGNQGWASKKYLLKLGPDPIRPYTLQAMNPSFFGRTY